MFVGQSFTQNSFSIDLFLFVCALSPDDSQHFISHGDECILGMILNNLIHSAEKLFVFLLVLLGFGTIQKGAIELFIKNISSFESDGSIFFLFGFGFGLLGFFLLDFESHASGVDSASQAFNFLRVWVHD